MKKAVGFAAALALVAAPAFAGTDLEKFEKKLAKHAPETTFTKRGAFCVCQDGTALDDHAGRLFQLLDTSGTPNVNVMVGCNVMFFDKQTEEFTANSNCWDYVVLGR